jgi:transposase
MRYLVGLDWAHTEHAVCVLDPHAERLARFTIAHSAAGLAELVSRLRRYGPPDQTSIAIERPSGLLVDTLLNAGFRVVPIHPNVLKASRPRYSAAQGKSDPGDAYILADLLRTDGHRFRALLPLSDETRALRAMVRGRDDLVAQRVALANQLRALLEGFWPGAAAIFAAVDSPIALAFLTRYPTPHSAQHLGAKRLATFLARNAYCGRRPAALLLERLRTAPPGHNGEAEAEAKGELVHCLVEVLKPLVAEIQQLTAAIEHAVLQHSDGPVFTSLPRAGRINAAQILAEVGDDRSRFDSEDHLAAEAGVAPVTKASGKHHAVTFRWACNKRLRQALTCFADNSRHASPWAATVYQRARSRGCDHPHAIRVLARAWCRVLWACWQQRLPYNPASHRAAQALPQGA